MDCTICTECKKSYLIASLILTGHYSYNNGFTHDEMRNSRELIGTVE